MTTRPAASPRHPHAESVVPQANHHAGRTWTVAGDGTADFSSIADAVTAADAGDTIVIAAGLYLESLHIDKAVHLVGPGDPRFVEHDIDSDDEPYALIMGTDFETIRWTANGGSIRDLVISRASRTSDSLPTSTLLRMRTGKVRVERCILAEGAHSAVECRGGDIELIRCHVRNVNIGATIIDTAMILDRTHIEGPNVLALDVETGATATLTDNCFEGRTVLRGDVLAFEGNDIDTLFVHHTLNISGNRMSTVVHVCDFRSEPPVAVSI